MDLYFLHWSCRGFNSADVYIISLLNVKCYRMSAALCVCVRVMFNQRRCETEIPQCHMAVTWSPLSPFVLGQKQGSESVLPLNKPSFFFNAAAGEHPATVQHKHPVTQRGRKSEWTLTSSLWSWKHDQGSVRIINVFPIRNSLHVIILTLHVESAHNWTQMYFTFTMRSDLIRRVNWSRGVHPHLSLAMTVKTFPHY